VKEPLTSPCVGREEEIGREMKRRGTVTSLQCLPASTRARTCPPEPFNHTGRVTGREEEGKGVEQTRRGEKRRTLTSVPCVSTNSS